MEKNKITTEGWVTRDKDGWLWFWRNCTLLKNKNSEIWELKDYKGSGLDLKEFNEAMPDVQWEDEEPTRAKITIEKI